MRTFWILWKREIIAFFRTPRAYVVMVLFLLLMGFNFYAGVNTLNHGSTKLSIVEAFFNTPSFWIAFLFLVPLLTIPLFSEEYQTGTIETLMTAPIRGTQVVFAKFLSALGLLIFLFLPTLIYFILFWPSAHQIAATGYGAYLGAYGMLFLLGIFYLSIGCLSSALTSYQLIAGMTSFTFIGMMFFIEMIIAPDYPTPFLAKLITLIAPKELMINFSRGLIDTRPIVFYLSMTSFVLFLTVQVLQLRRRLLFRWRIALQILSAFCLVLGINYIAFRHYGHFDFSRSHRFSLSDQGSVLFADIKQPAHIIIYCSPTSLAEGAELYGDLKALMQEYQIKARENLIVEYLDPTRNLSRAREIQGKYQFNSNENIIVIDYLNHNTIIPIKELGEYDTLGKIPRLIAFRGEQVINSALIGLSGVPLKKVYFLQGHGEMIPGVSPLEIIGRYLKHQNITTALLNLAVTIQVPEDAALIIIMGAHRDLSEAEAEALENYWQSSGRIIVLLDPVASTPLLYRVLQEGGITPCFDQVIRNLSTGILHDVTGEFIPGSELTKQFLSLNILFLGITQSLTLAPSSGNLQLRPLIQAINGFKSIPTSIIEPTQTNSQGEEKENQIPIVLAAMADRGALHDDRVAVKAARMVVVGNCDFIKDKNLGDVGLNFFSSSLNGLIDRVQLTGNTAKMKAYYTLNLSEEEMKRIALWCILIIPALAACLGMMIIWKRRN
ncbi:MAG: hypothetical protein A3F67_06795 [Verrucomicrobia bacterium RIFCSPHIGHO2_12_FULL_41_10]|nr:MAG: hypothetical protein A3F67_06795 [Verrucomicrobia bacterium RIFCSPHIGHO2_12_FULL_41_10]HLB33267.1 Gldg family protein [Chthoniobacterales bacterium]